MFKKISLASLLAATCWIASPTPASAACDLQRYGQDVHFCCVNGWLTILQAAENNNTDDMRKYFNFCQQNQPNGPSNARNSYFCAIQQRANYISTAIAQCQDALQEFNVKASRWRRF